ncbi:MAG: zinc ribbon domain-containing protein [Gemmatimonadota bacterium]
MTELERLTATLLAQWHAEGGTAGGPIPIAALLDRVLPYRRARRLLGIDVSEDYEALLLRLLAEEEGLVEVHPAEAAEQARATLATKLPDLDVLQRLRPADVTVRADTVSRLEGVLQMPPARAVDPAPVPGMSAAIANPEPRAFDDIPAIGVGEDGPINDADIIPLPVSRTVADAIRVALEDREERTSHPPTPEFLTAVQFHSPSESCWGCGEALPEGRSVKFCPFCGADQRAPTCPACGSSIERQWKHCAECGIKLGG